MNIKICTKCGESKEEKDFYFRSPKSLNDRHSHCKKCHWLYYQKKQDMEYRDKKKPYMKNYQRIRKLANYGLTQDAYNQLLIEQDNKCKLCGKVETVVGRDNTLDPLSIDHCHNTNRVRALLCRKCNTGLGCFVDSPELLQKAIDYLKTFC